MRTVRYVIVDVFTDRPLTGNQLGVFTDARGLDAATMQALARELGFSESVFVLPRSSREADAQIRIFTPSRELPFAGHPVLGTAFVLAAPMQRDIVRVETSAGIVPVHLEREGARIIFGWMAQPIPTPRPFDRASELLDVLGVPASGLPIEVYDLGPHHVFVELTSANAVAALRPDPTRLAPFGIGINTFARHGERWKTRMFLPSHGINEDAATGSAAGPLAVHLARHGRVPWGQEIVIEQGAEISRPSLLHARVHGSAERIEAVEVGGSAVIVSRGEFNLRL